MKKPILLLITVLCFSFSSIIAQNLIALQHNGASTFYTTIPEAVAAAASGDTIYLPGGSFPGFDIDKKLTIIGVGHHPDSIAATGITLISGAINFSNGDCDGSTLIGLRVYWTISNGYDNDNVWISRCFLERNIYSGFGSENWIISECILLTIASLKNSLLENNLIISGITEAQSCQIRNNIFFYTGNYIPVSGSSCTVKNNIFKYFSYNGSSQSISLSLFDNNIWSSGVALNGIFGNGNIGTGNINDTDFDGLFNNFSYASYSGNPDNLYQFDFHLVNLAYNIGGTDGAPIGIYGGTFPWKDGSIPFNPQIIHKSIGNTTDADGNLQINIHVKAQEN
jgi:hypothetical protein